MLQEIVGGGMVGALWHHLLAPISIRPYLSDGIFREYFKEIMERKDLLSDTLKQLLDIKKLLKEATPRESGISV